MQQPRLRHGRDARAAREHQHVLACDRTVADAERPGGVRNPAGRAWTAPAEQSGRSATLTASAGGRADNSSAKGTIGQAPMPRG